MIEEIVQCRPNAVVTTLFFSSQFPTYRRFSSGENAKPAITPLWYHADERRWDWPQAPRTAALTWIVEEEAWEQRSPVLHDPHDFSLCEVGPLLDLRPRAPACAVDGHLHDGILIVKDQGATDCQGNRLVSVIEFPTVDALPASGS
jgi:hypothetical protein